MTSLLLMFITGLLAITIFLGVSKASECSCPTSGISDKSPRSSAWAERVRGSVDLKALVAMSALEEASQLHGSMAYDTNRDTLEDHHPDAVKRAYDARTTQLIVWHTMAVKPVSGGPVPAWIVTIRYNDSERTRYKEFSGFSLGRSVRQAHAFKEDLKRKKEQQKNG